MLNARGKAISSKKLGYEERFNDLLDEYSKVLFVTVDNVTSQQIHGIRRALKGKGQLIMGKKTLQRKIVSIRSQKESATPIDVQFAQAAERNRLLRNNTGLIFTNCEPREISQILQNHRVKAPARAGAISPCEVVVPAGNTGMDPTATSFFQALNIATTILKGSVQITTDKKVLSVGDKVDFSTAALLQKLKINPFYYGMDVTSVWDKGVVFLKEDLDMTDDVVEQLLIDGIQKVSALAAGAGIPTSASFSISVADAFKNLLAASVGSDFVFSEFGADKSRTDILEGKVVAAAPTAAAPAPAEAPKQEEVVEEEDDDDDMALGGLF